MPRLFLLACLALAVAGCDSTDEDQTALAYIDSRSSLDVLADALGRAGLADALDAESATLTVFAPTDDAFAGVDLDALSTEELIEALEGHVVSGAALLSGEIIDGQTVTTLSGSRLTLRVDADGVTVGDARVVSADAEVTNGVVHEIDAVLD